MMKDLYTFDYSHEKALATYDVVREAYKNLFDELKLPYLVADADSGNMGGKLSHEYHFISEKGEDNVWSCDSCDYVANEELVEKQAPSVTADNHQPLVFTGISMDRSKAINIHIPRPSTISAEQTPTWQNASQYVNLHAVKKAEPDLDTGVEAATLHSLLTKTTTTVDVFDRSISDHEFNVDVTITKPGDACAHCESGKLSVQKAIEVGHTFHLGTRYSEPLKLFAAGPDNSKKEAIHMGCHGIGVSRLIGAIASLLAEPGRLYWPRVIAPYEAAIIAAEHISEEDSIRVYDALAGQNGSPNIDVVLDDRPTKRMGYKMKDADIIGYPVLVIVGNSWKERREVEVQCLRARTKKFVGLEHLRDEVLGLLEKW
jgi:prolyl-tRNA synthetase